MAQIRRSRGHPLKKPVTHSLVLLLTVLTLILSACGGSPSSQQQASSEKTALDKQINHAKSIGVPLSLLQPIINQEQQLSQSSAPFSLFSDQPATDHNTHLATSYKRLTIQTKGLENQATQQIGRQAVLNMQDFQSMLSQRQSQGFVEAATFTEIYNTQQQKLQQAQLPKDLVDVRDKAGDASEALRLLGTAFDKLTALQTTIQQMKDSKLEVSQYDTQVKNNIQDLRAGKTASDYNNVINDLDAEIQSTVTLSAQTIPYVGESKLNQFSQAINDLKQYGGDTSTYDQHLQSDRDLLTNAKTQNDYLKFSSQIDGDLASIRIPTVQAHAKYLVQQYQNEVNNWRNSHVYHDPFDGQDYKLGGEYDTLPNDYGSGSDLNDALNAAQNQDDYQAVIDLETNLMTNLKASQANYNDTTAWNQPHATDKQLMDYYKTSGQVIVLSISEQAVRIYQDGQLIHSIQIVSGRYERPTPAGFTHIFVKESPAKFTSYDPPGSTFYYEPITLKYALEFHTGGYFFHDVEWRGVFGNGANHRSNLPHADPVDQHDGGDGSHGCVNMPESEAAWMYNNINYNTAVIAY